MLYGCQLKLFREIQIKKKVFSDVSTRKIRIAFIDTIQKKRNRATPEGVIAAKDFSNEKTMVKKVSIRIVIDDKYGATMGELNLNRKTYKNYYR